MSNSDYIKPRTRLDKLLPEVISSDTSRTVAENLFNRFLTKNETKRAAGYIGDGNPKAIVNRQIREPTVHRQAFQLQPVLNAKVGSIERMSSWKDILNELERLGVDIERLPIWGSIQQFNWAPPIDLDKLINYQDYYWYDESSPNSRPEYITIRNRCTQASAYVNFWQSLIAEYGENFPIAGVLPASIPVIDYPIVAINDSTNEVIIQGNITEQIYPGQYFEISETTNNNGSFSVVATSYDQLTNRSTLIVDSGVLVGVEMEIGVVNLYRYDKLVFNGDYGRLLEPGFSFFIENSSNPELNNSFATVIATQYDELNSVTTVTIERMITSNIADGQVSLVQGLEGLQREKDCLCTGTTGWDQTQWDDNPEMPLWSDTLLAAITYPDGPTAPPTLSSPPLAEEMLWYDTGSDTLYEWSLTTNSWTSVRTSFSTTLSDTRGSSLWDLVGNQQCSSLSFSKSADQWISTNKWLHKTDVPNFNIAKKAQFPIIEYDWDLELNEWTYTNYIWKYRTNSVSAWNESNSKPFLNELIPFTNFTKTGTLIVLDGEYGNQTNWYTPGKLFRAVGYTGILEVKLSYVMRATSSAPYQTHIELVSDPGAIGDLYPLRTSKNDPWNDYHTHWLFVGASQTVPVNHQTINPYLEVTSGFTSTTDYQYAFGDYSQSNVVLVNAPVSTFTLTPTLRTRALLGFDDVRVYVNGVRQYGTYSELSEEDLGIGTDNKHVAGITFLPGYIPSSTGQNVLIELGEATINDIGYSNVPVRTIENDTQFNAGVIDGSQPANVSLVEYRKVEQIKTSVNQYPLFDIYNVDGSPTYKANSIFAYQTSSDAPIQSALGARLVMDTGLINFGFEQYLIDSDNGPLYAYRDYTYHYQNYWFNPETQELKAWDGTSWSDYFAIDNWYAKPHVGSSPPAAPYDTIPGFIWFDTINNTLKEYDGVSTWIEAFQPVAIMSYDHTLKTIWRSGHDNEKYVPKKVDWQKRSLKQYHDEQVLFTSQRAQELEAQGVPELEAFAQATQEWFESQQNDLSPTGDWVGDWEIPDPLYYNHLHENKKIVSYRELITHFNTIIAAQPKVPGYNGPSSSSFHLLELDSVNFGLGGKIKEFNDGFDTFLSSIFVDNVTPLTLIEFAHDQYESLLNNLTESFRSKLIPLLTTTSEQSLIDFAQFASDEIINSAEENDNNAFIYGDTTTFTDNPGSSNDSGVRNWIATTPFLRLVRKTEPHRLIDESRGINATIHHDSHTNSYELPQATIENISRNVTRVPDPRAYVSDTFGRIGSSLPPANYSSFASAFNTTVENRTGVFWYRVPPAGERILYRLTAVSAGETQPSDDVPDGTMWVDTRAGVGTLRVKETVGSVVSWDPAPGFVDGDEKLTEGDVSAWAPIDINSTLNDIIFDVETKLYDNAPSFTTPAYDLKAVESLDPVLYDQYLEAAFLNYVSQREIAAPFKNADYSFSDPFTWNYKYSTIGAGYEILETNEETESFTIAGNQLSVFGLPYMPFYIKNSGVNDGTWLTRSPNPAAIYDVDQDITTVYVVSMGRQVQSSSAGVIYVGMLPSSINSGAESGGDWKDLYQKFYNTPYPHLEPWKLQGYTSKPDWWEQQFAVSTDEDIATFGDRKWKYAHGMPIVQVSAGNPGTFYIDGNFTDTFTSSSTITIVGSPTHDGTYNVIDSWYSPISNRTAIDVAFNIISSVVEGRIANGTGMWEYIRTGTIPAGKTYPNGETSVTGNPTTDRTTHNVQVTDLPTYNYFSVNVGSVPVSSDGGTTTYQPDQVLPPYWDYRVLYGSAPQYPDSLIRSLYTDFNTEIVAPSTDFAFGDAGPIEWEWRVSSQYLYDQLTIAFRLDPVRFVTHTFGKKFLIVDGLQIDSDTKTTFSHTRTNFHGEIVDDKLYQVNGTNQWYINYNRYVGFDASYSDFRTMWTQWIAPLTYQFSAFVDTQSLTLGHRTIPITEFDWRIASKRSPGVEDYWCDALNINVTNMPPPLVRYNNQSDWKFEIGTNLPITRTLKYYDVKNYMFTADPDTDICSLYTYPIAQADPFSNTISVNFDQTDTIKAGMSMEVAGSTSNDDIYLITAVAFDPVTNRTVISVATDIASNQASGTVTLSSRTLPWQTGDRVYLSTNEQLPLPLENDTEYFIIVLDNTSFKLAETRDNALEGIAIDLISAGRQNQYVGQLSNTFTALNGSTTDAVWKHYELDTSTVRTAITPFEMSGVQNIVNFIVGFERYLYDQGWRVNATGALKDPEIAGRGVSWQLELERFINFIYGLRRQRNRPNSIAYPVTYSGDNTFTFPADNYAEFLTGDPVVIRTDTSVYPIPLAHNFRYFVIRDSLTNFRLAGTKLDAERGNAIEITPITGYSTITVSPASNARQVIAEFEINPFRNGIWFKPQAGIVSNIFTGPTDDVRTSQLVFDQYGRPLDKSKCYILREDKQTQITVQPNIPNDVELTSVFNDPYNYIHLGGLHLFVDAYEHVLIFNNYTTENLLIYNPFVGLNVTKFELQFQRQVGFTQRPNVGGYYYETFFNQNASLKRNIEASIEDLRYLYDTYTSIESDSMIAQSRKTLGFDGIKSYLSDLNLNPKSQFIFWRGMIQRKGSVNAIKAFINSRRFIDARVDEFWAVKIADFGSSSEKEYPELFLTTNDAKSNDLRLDFITEDDLCLPGYAMNVYDQEPCGYAFPEDGSSVLVGSDGFIPILSSNEERWYNQPDQMKLLEDNGGTLYFTLKPIGVVNIDFKTITPPVSSTSGTEYVNFLNPLLHTSNNDGLLDPFEQYVNGQMIIVNDTTNFVRSAWVWDSIDLTWTNAGTWETVGSHSNAYVRHNLKADTTEITLKWYGDGYNTGDLTGHTGNQLTLANQHGYIPFANSIKVFRNGTLLTSSIDYSETLGSGLLSYEVFFPTALTASDVVRIEFTTSSLVDGLHYQQINANIVQFLYKDIVDLAHAKDMKIWGLMEDDNSQTPAKIIDIISQTVVTPVQIWDPARGIHYYNGIHNVDVERDTDPATYTNTPLSSTQYSLVERGVGYNRIVPDRWNVEQVGKTWLDTSTIDYFTYYDINATPDIETRFGGWGNLADWASISVREWVQSDVPPEEWNALAAREENDISIIESERKSGRVSQRLFKKDGSDWVRYTTKVQHVDVSIDGEPNGVVATAYTFEIDDSLGLTAGSPADTFNVYVNGRLLKEATYTGSTITLTTNEIKLADRVTFVKFPPTNQEEIDAGVEAGTLLQAYEYTQTDYVDQFGVTRTHYYFWVDNKLTKGKTTRTLSPAETQRQLVAIPSPYMFFHNLKQPVREDSDEPFKPLRYSQSIIRGLRGLIDADRRYILRYMRDYTLRDSLDNGKTELQLKNKHEEWKLIREFQTGKLDQWLWDRITESIVGFKLDDNSKRIPSLNRELYDEKFDTDTSFGLGDDQAFADGELALQCILYDLQNPNNEFDPIDIDLFFEQFSFDTPENIINSMNEIYASFPAEHINRMFFSVVHNAAFSQKTKYADIFKTSMIALHGIRPFQTRGMFDD